MDYKKCEGPAGPYCKTLSDRFADGRTGLSVFAVTSIRTRVRRVVGVVHRLDAKDVGLMLNRCPWCGANIEPEEKKASKPMSEAEKVARDIARVTTRDIS